MRLIVKKLNLRIEARAIPRDLLDFLRSHYGPVQFLLDDDMVAEPTPTIARRDTKNVMTPGEAMRFYRKRAGVTQAELGLTVGRFTRQAISDMESGRRSISKTVAKKLSQLFKESVEKFI